MTSILRSTAAAALAALTLGAAVAGAPSSASAHERGFPVVAGILGGLAAGALIAGAAEAHPYEYAPAAPAYVPAPVYAPAPVYDEDAYEAPVQVRYERECWRQPVRQWGPWHEFIGWREVKVCR